jgi:hypothetical protein
VTYRWLHPWEKLFSCQGNMQIDDSGMPKFGELICAVHPRAPGDVTCSVEAVR